MVGLAGALPSGPFVRGAAGAGAGGATDADATAGAATTGVEATTGATGFTGAIGFGSATGAAATAEAGVLHELRDVARRHRERLRQTRIDAAAAGHVEGVRTGDSPVRA
jgi:hypothetical protein